MKIKHQLKTKPITNQPTKSEHGESTRAATIRQPWQRPFLKPVLVLSNLPNQPSPPSATAIAVDGVIRSRPDLLSPDATPTNESRHPCPPKNVQTKASLGSIAHLVTSA
jgi:hypothetical protein